MKSMIRRPVTAEIERRIFTIRGRRVMLDADLAAIYGVTTARLNEQVKRNLDRFPPDFVFQITRREWATLISQFATSKTRGGRRKCPFIFKKGTEGNIFTFAIAAILLTLINVFAAPPAFAAAVSTPAQDNLARAVGASATLSTGMKFGTDSRVIEILSVKEFVIPAAAPASAPPAVPTNLAANKPAKSSATCAVIESASKAFDGTVTVGRSGKWCSLASAKYLEVDLGAAASLTEFVIHHAQAGGEAESFNTKDFEISVSGNGTNWTKVVAVTGNTRSVTRHSTTSAARHVRLNISAPTQSGDPAARIYEFEVFGTPVVPAALTFSPAELSLDAGGKVSASAGARTIKMSGAAFAQGDAIRFKFSSATVSWSTTINVGSPFQFTTVVPQSPVSLTIAGQAAATAGGADVSMSSVDIKYTGVEFMKKCEWTVDADVTSAGIPTGKGSLKVVVSPGAAVLE